MPKHSYHLLPTRAWSVILLPLFTSLCAAAPPAKGVEVQGGVGGSGYEYSSGGCGTTSYVNKAAEARSYAQVTHRSDSGLSATAEANINYDNTYQSSISASNQSEELDQRGKRDGSSNIYSSLALRPGFHTDYIGLELGVFLDYRIPFNRAADDEESLFHILPSGRLWLGLPKYVYGWWDFFAGPNSQGHPGFALGLGHATDTLRLEGGYTGNNAYTLRGQLKVSDGLWFGAQAHAGFEEEAKSYGGLLTFALDLDTESDD